MYEIELLVVMTCGTFLGLTMFNVFVLAICVNKRFTKWWLKKYTKLLNEFMYEENSMND